ncbi:lanC-like protein GCR2 [Colletotrichum spaethianum]|uniref:LanC-like protein GCR2 n=1 Tax=Colletotrichum spaethianum TaxID=700344 RepID=A0AA37PF72_9PEZI|nr:lanC-like protein GCR2 [Colletotrichum spaethianum]GKT51170.1 lanC-like protein GCR2 [Colletotrichum spaethianum]
MGFKLPKRETMDVLNMYKPRFINNPDLPQDYLSFREKSEVRVQEALIHIIGETHPREHYTQDECRGFFRGPTALAYLLLRIHAIYPEIKIRGESPQYWASSYLSAKRTGGNSASCGLACESAAYYAVEAMLDETKAPRFRDELGKIVEEEEHPYEILFGLTGLLYMIRAVEFFKPETASLLITLKARIVDKTLAAGPAWTFRGKRYIGAVHGDVGILTQLLLTDPSLATNSIVRKSLQRQLQLQHESGNWPTRDPTPEFDRVYLELVQFCHGAPGFVLSLLHLEQMLPDMKEQIGNAIMLGRKCIWQEGLLKKEPCLCHGILGNSL